MRAVIDFIGAGPEGPAPFFYADDAPAAIVVAAAEKGIDWRKGLSLERSRMALTLKEQRV